MFRTVDNFVKAKFAAVKKVVVSFVKKAVAWLKSKF